MKKWLSWVKWTLSILIVGGFLLWVLVHLLASFADHQAVTFGVSFSKSKAQALGLDWQETYLAILDELHITEVRLFAHWDDIEQQPGQLVFDDLLWMLAEADKRKVKVLMAVGYKLPGWPECHVPSWAKDYPVEVQHGFLVNSLPAIINRLKVYDAIWAWQVENEPFFRFGDCPTWWVPRAVVEKEVAIVHALDHRPVAITQSGEIDLWTEGAKRADLVGASVYRRIWNRYLAYTYPFTPTFYRAKAGLVKRLYGRRVFLHEVQAEPWSPGILLKDLPLADQYRTMSPNHFREQLGFVRDIGLSPAYLWGAEWWYWLKSQKGETAIWQEAQSLWP